MVLVYQNYVFVFRFGCILYVFYGCSLMVNYYKDHILILLQPVASLTCMVVPSWLVQDT